MQIKRERMLENRLGLWNNISYKVKKAGETAFNELPIGIIVINNQYTVMWANKAAKRIFESLRKNQFGKHFATSLFVLKPGEKEFVVDIYGKVYKVIYIQEHNVVYFSDITEMVQMETKYQSDYGNRLYQYW